MLGFTWNLDQMVGLVMIDDTTVLERALKILDEMAGKTEEAVRA